mmetsp:Transcript_23430/g.42286  ORF Transcript_23430/g.42286 Transcript_23430/m.42286 type:complete len:240 (-) Transcript_23430:98-817(-)|eukprot:CAMPEP_0197663566 /NCGR_PEP_ID=MMETSP1338-20131121/57937_1 /TAXON_ID=43686 ORGANISM="Pelagodinium beii, Strain RCC1491" /NCGR_SAMPLE_ID=MMETSP1338 /ASSEMBLY_ACC=CAM_ASM_000754 /LENGTH=239 /DNA_ID=CAMNT_0043242003 /DNA_START=21 /DNA_END=740 /DNA_ORIENTATION=-
MPATEQGWGGYLLAKHGHVALASQLQQKQDVGRLRLYVHGAFDLPNMELTGTSDPYAVIAVGNARQRTATVPSNLNPIWGETMVFPVALSQSSTKEPINVNVEIWDANITKDVLMCACVIEVSPEHCSAKQSCRKVKTQILKKPKGDDGGIFRYSAEVASMNVLEARTQELEALAMIPILPTCVRSLQYIYNSAGNVCTQVSDMIPVSDFLRAPISTGIRLGRLTAMRVLKSALNVMTK